MDECDRYGFLFKNMINAYAFHRIILDENKKPIDYEYIEVNKAFEEFMGIKSEDIVGKHVTEIFPNIKNDPADWINRYGKIALDGGSDYFEDFSPTINKWFKINVFSMEQGYFVTIFDDITEYKNKEKMLSDKVEELEKMNRIMMQRELKMIEMKKELTDLKCNMKNGE